MTEANLQADGLMEEPAQRAANQQEMEEEDSSPPNLQMWSPVQRLPMAVSILTIVYQYK